MRDNKDIRIVQTNDGSSTLQIDALNETYHSTHGAIQESLYVFVNQGFDYVDLSELSILEVGFGTGLNALLTMLNSDKHTVSYVGLETNPLPKKLVEDLRYGEQLHLTETQAGLFEGMHSCDWEVSIGICPGFDLEKREAPVQELKDIGVFDLVYYDAFGPRAQAEMWEITALEPVVRAMKPGGVLVTYCAQGAFKRNLKALDLTVEELPGPPGKRQMTRASRS